MEPEEEARFGVRRSEPVRCEICGKEFDSVQKLGPHLMWCRRKREEQTSGQSDSQPQPIRTGEEKAKKKLTAMRMIEQGFSPIEIMETLELSASEMTLILQDYQEIMARVPKGIGPSEAFITLARLFGEKARDSCEYYDDVAGVCNYYALYDVDPDLRKANPGLIKGTKGGKNRYMVSSHPEVCVLCGAIRRRG